jgi:hypothetical protein
MGKSTILDAIQLALSNSRRDPFFDTDFYNLNAEAAFQIHVSIGALPDELRDVDRYGDYLRGWNAAVGVLEDEPSVDCEDVLTLQLFVGADLEGIWSLYSERTEGQDARDLSLAHRALIAPVVLDRSPETHLRWTRQSILQHLASPQLAIRTLVAQAARAMREQNIALDADTEAVLSHVHEVGRELGIRPAQDATVQIDAFGNPTWSATLGLHDVAGIPLRKLGIGSARLLVSGLFRSRLQNDGIALVDEIEHGLEPHRIARLLRVLGAGNNIGPQVFLTSHSPVVIRELGVAELAVMLRNQERHHRIFPFPPRIENVDMQAIVRACPEALLAPRVLIAEGPTEIGLIRGLDLFWSTQNREPLALRGVAVADGGGIPQGANRSLGFANAGYHTSLFMDDDRPLTNAESQPLVNAGVTVLTWGGGHSTEEAIFSHLAWEDVRRVVQIAEATWSADLLNQHIQSFSNGQQSLAGCVAADEAPHRELLGRVAKDRGWFKRIDLGTRVGGEVVGPGLTRAAEPLQTTIERLRNWIDGG